MVQCMVRFSMFYYVFQSQDIVTSIQCVLKSSTYLTSVQTSSMHLITLFHVSQRNLTHLSMQLKKERLEMCINHVTYSTTKWSDIRKYGNPMSQKFGAF